MKLKFGLILAATLSTSVIAQVATNAPAPVAAPDSASAPAQVTPPDASATGTNAPAKAKKSSKKKKPAKKATDAKKETKPEAPAAAPFMANDLAVAKQNNTNIRGQSHINSEVIGHLQKGDTVTVLEEITLKHPKTDEPSHWARITLPASVHVWVNTSFIDTSNQVVSARKLNLRGGPGENYSVLGLLHKGDAIKSLETKGGWTQVEAPTNAFAFVAAHLLAHKEAEPIVPPPANPPIAAVVEPQTQLAPPPSANPPAQLPQPVAAPAPVIPPPVIPAPLPQTEEPLPQRIVQRDGIVGGTVSIQAPSHYELRSIDNGDVMDYLYTTSTNVVLKRYKGLTVHVTGEESLDERWPNTPVLTIHRIQVVK